MFMKYAIIDLGSNTIRLSLYSCSGGDFKPLMNKKVTAGLAGYIKNGELGDGGILLACRVLCSFRELAENLGAEGVSVFGTAPLRNIVNTEEAVNTIRAVTGIDVDVLSGAEEAQLSYTGAVWGGSAPRTGLLADIGGGSTELVAYSEGRVSAECSLPVGSLSMYNEYVSGLFPGKEERREMRERVKREIARAGMPGNKYLHLVGVGGTIRAAAKLYGKLTDTEPASRLMSAGDLAELYKGLKRGGKRALELILRTAPERIHTILPGMAILTSVLTAFGVESVSISERGVREGYLLSRVIGASDNAG